MRITRDEAAAALSEIDETTGRLGQQRGYHIAGPYLMLWGVIWMIGYGAMGVLPPEQWGWVWLVLNVLGVGASIALGTRARRAAGHKGAGWRSIIGMFAIFGFVAATFSLLQPSDPAGFMAYPGILAGFLYAIVGLVKQPRFLVVGATVFAATLVGFFFFQPVLPFWMAVVGGGGLLIGGLWMRSA